MCAFTVGLSVQEQLFFRVLLYCGLRNSEARKIKVEDVDIEHGCITLTKTKSGHSQTVPIPSALLQPLSRLVDVSKWIGCTWLFPSIRRLDLPYSRATLTRRIDQICRRARIDKHVTCHSLRHSFCTLLRKGGAPLPVVQKAARHRSPATTKGYTHWVPSLELHEAIARTRTTIVLQRRATGEFS